MTVKRKTSWDAFSDIAERKRKSERDGQRQKGGEESFWGTDIRFFFSRDAREHGYRGKRKIGSVTRKGNSFSLSFQGILEYKKDCRVEIFFFFSTKFFFLCSFYIRYSYVYFIYHKLTVIL